MKQRIQLVTNAINSDMVRKEEFQGEMHYMIRSATMPDDIVMNSVLYPAEEIEASYMGLEQVHAPLGHPVDDNGDFVSAATPFAVRNYGIGAQVVNVRRENGRVFHDTAINIAAAKQSERGKRVLDRVEALMNGDDTRPIHSSTGVFLSAETLDEPQSNQYGEYNVIGRGLVFDHNAILLDEVGAATPEQGTGMAVNSSNTQDVYSYVLNTEIEVQEEAREITFTLAEEDKTGILNSLKSFIKSMGFATSIHEAYNGRVNNQTEESEMTKEEMQALLAEQSETMQANFDEKLASVVNPLKEEITALKANAEAGEKAEKAELAEKLGLDAEEAQAMSVNTLQKLVAKTADAGEFAGDRLGAFEVNAQGGKPEFSTELPEG